MKRIKIHFFFTLFQNETDLSINQTSMNAALPIDFALRICSVYSCFTRCPVAIFFNIAFMD